MFYVRALEITQCRQSVEILYFNLVAFDHNKAFIAKLTQGSADMDTRQSEDFPDLLLRQRHAKTTLVTEANDPQPHQQFQQEMCYALRRRPLTCADQAFGIHRRFAGK